MERFWPIIGGMVTVHRFRIFDPVMEDWVVQLSKSPLVHIEKIGGRIIAGTAEEVDAALIDEQGRYVPSVQQGPHARSAQQTQP
jgi:hypothetical protein